MSSYLSESTEKTVSFCVIGFEGRGNTSRRRRAGARSAGAANPFFGGVFSGEKFGVEMAVRAVWLAKSGRGTRRM